MEQSTPTADAAIDALESEAARQLQLREDLFGDGDVAGAKAADDLAWAYRTSLDFLRRNRARWSCRSKRAQTG